eukprot:2429430-Prymnesium_polylepis.1
MTGRGKRVRQDGAHPQPQTCPQIKIRLAVFTGFCALRAHHIRIRAWPWAARQLASGAAAAGGALARA